MTFPDLEAVEKLVHEACAARGFVYIDSSDKEAIDYEALKRSTYDVMMEHHVVEDADKMSKGAITQHELYEAIFPEGPGARRQPTSDEESEARNVLSRKLWSYTNTGTTGHVNQRVEAEGLTLIMCEASVARTYRSEETGRPAPKTEPGRFLTDNGDLIANYSTLPRALKLVKAAEATAKHATMALRRHPELANAIGRQLTNALSQSKAALNAASTGKPAPTLTASKPEDEPE